MVGLEVEGVAVDTGCPSRDVISAGLGARCVLVELCDESLAQSMPPAAIAILPAWDARGQSTLPVVRIMRRSSPRTIIALNVTKERLSRCAWPVLARAGADDVLVHGSDEVSKLRTWTNSHLTSPAPAIELLELQTEGGEPFALAVASFCFRNAIRCSSVSDVATWFCISERSLRRRLHDSGFPATDFLLRCGRILHAAELDRRGLRSRRQIANRIGYEDAASLWSAKAGLRQSAARNPTLIRFLKTFPSLWWALPAAERIATGLE